MDLKTFFKNHPNVALGFSGGVDSSYLLYAGLLYGANIKPYFVKTLFQPDFELEDALKIGKQLNVDITIIEKNILSELNVIKNPSNRCYYCKKEIFGTLKREALNDGFSVLIDGTNASDDISDRPGMKALSELSVLSPLRECNLTKDEIRKLSREAGLFTWNKPAYACLATRIPTGNTITSELLKKIEVSESALFNMGFSNFRVRVFENAAKLQFPENQMETVIKKRTEILNALKPYFNSVLLDLEERS